MSPRIIHLPETDSEIQARDDSGLGALRTERGNLPLFGLDIDCHISGLTARTVITQRFRNPHPDPIEAEYVFPLPERAAVTGMTMAVADRTINAELRERAAARQSYRRAVESGKRAAIAEAERADVFTMRMGNIPAGETATVTLTMVGPLAFEDDEATLRVPLVVAPRYIPGAPMGGPPVGSGHTPDTDAVPDASRVTPPVLLPGFPNPVALSITATIETADLTLDEVRSSLHTVEVETNATTTRLRVEPGERLNRDFILRFTPGSVTAIASALRVVPDATDPTAGTFELTVMPPRQALAESPPKDLVVLLDRSGSMQGWKMVAARRAAARVVDTLSTKDRFAVRCFDHQVEGPEQLGAGLCSGTDRHRFRAVEYLAAVTSRGSTDIMTPMSTAVELLGEEPERDRVIVLVTDGQVGNEDQILSHLSGRLEGTRVHVVGIDKAVNAGFLHRLALLGRGRVELVESEDRLDAATAHIHRRIVSTVVAQPQLRLEGAELEPQSLAPSRIPDLFAGAPLTTWGRYRGGAEALPTVTLTGADADGQRWSQTLTAHKGDSTGIRSCWAKAHLRDAEDSFAAAVDPQLRDRLEKEIVDVSLRYGVLSRFTAFVAVDSQVVTEGGKPRTIVQPVEAPAGWEGDAPQGPPPPAAGCAAAPMAYSPPPAPPGAPAAVPPGFAGAPAAMPVMNHRVAAPRATAAPSPQRRNRERELAGLVDSLRAESQALRAEAESLDALSPKVRERRQRALLSDLTTRLGVIADELSGFGESSRRQRLTELVAALTEAESSSPPPSGAPLQALWDRTLDDLAALSRQETGTADAKPDDGEPQFWKRPI